MKDKVMALYNIFQLSILLIAFCIFSFETIVLKYNSNSRKVLIKFFLFFAFKNYSLNKCSLKPEDKLIFILF